ncbi:hypothetical protein [Pontixanthobacter sp.]|uniref:hypothetical protein n=1 Tax=Pontixanthobacter sp. TaxID=2792078 RepID=UPI003C7DF0AE
MAAETSSALIAAGAAIGGVVIAWILSQMGSSLEHRRKKSDDQKNFDERVRSVLYGAFAVCNFLNRAINEWDEQRNVPQLSRLVVAQSYLTKLIERSPHESETLMVGLIDLGLRLESLLHLVESIPESGVGVSIAGVDSVELSVDELAASVEVLLVMLDGDNAMISADELAKIVTNPEDIPSED